MERRIVNPWEWQSRVGFEQAHEVRGAERLLFCSGAVGVVGRAFLSTPAT